MANHKTKLELTWIWKESRPKLEPRILLEEPTRSYHANHRVPHDAIAENMTLKGRGNLQRRSNQGQCSFAPFTIHPSLFTISGCALPLKRAPSVRIAGARFSNATASCAVAGRIAR